ncbi:MAG: O-acetylhomoserine aminocarboxypropyltransferase/cysteine synthase [Deltaproteobacteria bacterium]|nr:O-acetylhomoserine aminocarboxypropyltransferase/cysteine synthase [Deltaproteobacteria bacterium]
MDNSKTNRQLHFATRQLHAGQAPDAETGALVVPIHQTTSYVFRSTEHAARLFSLEETGNIYTRIMNPTTDVFERRMADLEGGVGALAASSGLAAQMMAIQTICNAGDHFISASTLYGGSYNQFVFAFKKLGIEVTIVNPSNPANFEAAIRDNTKLIFGESLGNPSINVFPFEAVSQIAKRHRIPLMIDNTFATAWLCRPIEWGANIVVYSTTKFIGGHGTAIGGMIIDAGNFNWKESGRFPQFTEPDESYHGLIYTSLGPAAYIIKARVQVLRDLGACQAPMNSWLFLQGLETLSLRMERHVSNTQKVAWFLDNHPDVSWVSHPSLPTHPDHDIARRYFPKGAGAVLSFGINGGLAAGRRFINNLKLFSHLANVGDAKSLAIHPASTTHSQLTPLQQKSAGVYPETIRLSVGIEDIDDILWDLDQALELSQEAETDPMVISSVIRLNDTSEHGLI